MTNTVNLTLSGSTSSYIFIHHHDRHRTKFSILAHIICHTHTLQYKNTDPWIQSMGKGGGFGGNQSAPWHSYFGTKRICCILLLASVLNLKWPMQSVVIHGSEVRNRDHHRHHHLSLTREGQWGTTDDFTNSFLHFNREEQVLTLTILQCTMYEKTDFFFLHSILSVSVTDSFQNFQSSPFPPTSDMDNFQSTEPLYNST